MKTLICRFGHECTSRCGNDRECPCQTDHCCALTYTCEGKEHCDDHYEALKERVFSVEQLAHITDMENQCADAGCDEQHNCNK